MSNGNGGSSVGVVAIIAILVLVGLGAWLMFGRSSPRQAAAPAPTEQKSTVEVKVNLPDSVTIK